MRIEEEFEFDSEEDAKMWFDGAISALNFSFDDETELECYTRLDGNGQPFWCVRLFRDIPD
jgi:hypothetical protein